MTIPNEQFLIEKNKKTNAPIHLAIVEITKAYFATVISTNASYTTLVVGSDLIAQWATDGFELNSEANIRGTGYDTFVTFEQGNNNGTWRKIHSVVGTTITLENAVLNTPVGDKIRISRCVCLAQWDDFVDFYVPDKSNSPSVSLRYIPFPMQIEPVGSSTTGEIMAMSASVSNVNKILGNAIQTAGGLRNNRLTHIQIFYDTRNQGKDCCMVNNMYIDTVTITPKDVVFTLESKLNIININLPFCNYNRDFCRWVFDSAECGFSTYGELNTTNYRLAKATSCDHTLKGPNGCTAHKNTRRFGGFPSLIGGT